MPKSDLAGLSTVAPLSSLQPDRLMSGPRAAVDSLDCEVPVRLTPSERDRLLLFTAAQLARARRERGLKLNVPEATALIADVVCEAARDGARLADAMAAGKAALGPHDVLPGVAEIVTEVDVEAVFDDGTRLVVVMDPIGGGSATEGPGAVLPGDAPPVTYSDVVIVSVTNTSAVPISVTSHFHFFEVNPRLRFDRAAAYGRRAAPSRLAPPCASTRETWSTSP